jgi:hypothetical protein
MSKLEKIIKLAYHYHHEIFDQGCLDLENSMTDNEIQQAINLARDLAKKESKEDMEDNV